MLYVAGKSTRKQIKEQQREGEIKIKKETIKSASGLIKER